MSTEKLLGPRLQAIFDAVRPGAVVADIGTDHAHIPIALVQEGMCEKVIAVDIKEGPLEIAKHNIHEYGYDDVIDVRLSDGLEAVSPDEVDTVIITGMGGTLICDILSRAIGFDSHDFILQPMTAQDELREFLFRNGYRIIREHLVQEDDKIYCVMVVVHEWEEEDEVDELYCHVGKSLIQNHDPLLMEFLERKYHQLSVIEDGLMRSESEDSRLPRIQNLKRRIAEVIEDVKMW